jgi:hypothetical protein
LLGKRIGSLFHDYDCSTGHHLSKEKLIYYIDINSQGILFLYFILYIRNNEYENIGETMAKMYPKGGPTKNASYQAEPMVYKALESMLPDGFVVIHSVRWLAQVAKEVDGRPVPVGEIDFLILHPLLEILALEIKEG